MKLTKDYKSYIETLKKEIAQSRIKANLAVNKELILLYWKIGKNILEMQEKEGWGAKVVEQVSKDLRKDFPEMRGLSIQNISYMRQFFQEYPENQIIQQAVGQIPWGHNILIISKVKDPEQRLWYVHQTIGNGWSRNVLAMQIDTKLYERQGQAITNFKETLPSPQSDLAHEIVKSPYNFEFLNIEGDIYERKLEKALVDHIRDFMLELGKGFAFIGSQYKLTLSNQDYYLDLLFYNLQLRCYTIIELKTGPFKPEYAGKMNFYLNVLDHEVKDEQDNASIGIILCREKDHITAKYALDGIKRPLGVSEYQLSKDLAEKLKEALPKPKDLEKDLEEELEK